MPVKHDVGVPDPFWQGGGSESSLGVSVRPPTTQANGERGSQQYNNIAEVGDLTNLKPLHHHTVCSLLLGKKQKAVFLMSTH